MKTFFVIVLICLVGPPAVYVIARCFSRGFFDGKYRSATRTFKRLKKNSKE
jgi:hypothetical protein